MYFMVHYINLKKSIIDSPSHLFGKLFLTQFVEGEELPGKQNVVVKPTAGQLDSNNDLSVWNHHGYSTEVDLQVLWKLLTTSIAWVLIAKIKWGR